MSRENFTISVLPEDKKGRCPFWWQLFLSRSKHLWKQHKI